MQQSNERDTALLGAVVEAVLLHAEVVLFAGREDMNTRLLEKINECRGALYRLFEEPKKKDHDKRQ